MSQTTLTTLLLSFLILVVSQIPTTAAYGQWQSYVESTRGMPDRSISYNTLNAIKNFIDADSMKSPTSKHWLALCVEIRAYAQGSAVVLLHTSNLNTNR